MTRRSRSRKLFDMIADENEASENERWKKDGEEAAVKR